jgi:surface carbohydrate biosynthesis protein
MNLRIALFVDSKFRDTAAAVMVKRELAKVMPDADVLLVSVDLWQQVLEYFSPHVAILNHAIGYRNQQIIRNVDVSIVLPTEGRPNTVEQTKWYVEEQDGNIDLFLSWNKSIASMFKDPRTRVVTTGAPRYDIYYHDTGLIDSREKARAKFGIKQDADVIGVFTSFPQAKFAFSQIEFNRKDWKDLGVTKISTRKDPLEFARQELKLRREFMAAIASLRYELGNIEFLVKPHPMEDVLQIQRWCDEHGFICVTQEPIYNVIAACDDVINRHGCMTTIDSWLMDKRVIEYGLPEAKGGAFMNVAVATPSQLTQAVVDGEWTKKSERMLSVYGLAHGNASKNVAREIELFLRDAPINRSREYSPAGRAHLANAMVQHAQQTGYPNPVKGQVGKAVTQGYIGGIEAVIKWE